PPGIWTKPTFGLPDVWSICFVPWTAAATLSISICRKREIERQPRRFCRRTTELHTCCTWTSAEYISAAIRDLQAEGRFPQRCRRRTKGYANNRIESDHRHVKRSVIPENPVAIEIVELMHTTT